MCFKNCATNKEVASRRKNLVNTPATNYPYVAFHQIGILPNLSSIQLRLSNYRLPQRARPSGMIQLNPLTKSKVAHP